MNGDFVTLYGPGQVPIRVIRGHVSAIGVDSNGRTIIYLCGTPIRVKGTPENVIECLGFEDSGISYEGREDSVVEGLNEVCSMPAEIAQPESGVTRKPEPETPVSESPVQDSSLGDL